MGPLQVQVRDLGGKDFPCLSREETHMSGLPISGSQTLQECVSPLWQTWALLC